MIIFWIVMIYILNVLIAYKIQTIADEISFSSNLDTRLFNFCVSSIPILGFFVACMSLIMAWFDDEVIRERISKFFGKLFYIPAKIISFIWYIISYVLSIVEKMPPRSRKE